MRSAHKILFILSLTSLLSLTSCCTQKDCGIDILPYIYLEFEEAGQLEQFEITITRLDKTSKQAVGSSVTRSGKATTFTPWHTYGESEALKFDYVISGPYNNSDTLYDLFYSIKKEKVDCNTCFPFGDGSSTSKIYENFSYKHKGVNYQSGDHLVLRK